MSLFGAFKAISDFNRERNTRTMKCANCGRKYTEPKDKPVLFMAAALCPECEQLPDELLTYEGGQ
jgi:Zn ribbon nucleic-acid-binding protein